MEKRILIVGKDVNNNGLLAEALKKEGYLVKIEAEVQTGLKHIGQWKPNLLLLDANGIEDQVPKTLGQVRKDSTDYIFITLLTEALTSSEKAGYLENGADDFLIKPFGRPELFARIKSRLKFQDMFSQADKATKKVKELSVTDDLTGLLNEVNLDKRFEHELTRAKRNRKWLSVIRVELDEFQKLMSSKGANFIQEVQISVGKVLRNWTRGIDLAARVTEGKFMVILPDTPSHGAERVAERLRSYIESTEFEIDGRTGRATASIGLVAANCENQTLTMKDLSGLAESMVAEAQKLGGNCIQKKTI